MSHFVIIELFLQFMSEGWSTNMSRQKTREHSGLKRATVWKVINESEECHKCIKERIEQSQDNKRFLHQGETTWN